MRRLHQVLHVLAEVAAREHGARQAGLAGRAHRHRLRPPGQVGGAGGPGQGQAGRGVEQVVAAHERGHEIRGRPVPDLLGRAALLDAARAHHDDAVRQAQRLVLVVRHVEHRDAELALQAAQLGAHLHPQLGVQVGQRLVQQQQARPQHDGPGQRHALLLPARQVGRQPRREVLETDRAQRLAHALAQLRRRHLAQPQPEGHVLEGTQVREQRVGLEHEPDVAPVRRHAGDVLPGQHDAAGQRREQAGHGAHRRRLAAARGPEQGDELALGHGQVQVLDRGAGLAVGQRQALEFEVVHRVGHGA